MIHTKLGICGIKVFGFVISFFFLFILFNSSALAEDRYWVGASDGANTSDTANWSASSGNACGVGGGASVPVSTDLAIFASDCTNGATINANLDVLGIQIDSGYSGTITQSASITIDIGTDGFIQNDGVFVGGDSNIDIDNTDLTGGLSFQLGSGADFTSTSGTMSFEEDFTIDSGATFTHNSGTITFDGSKTYDDSELDCGSKTFNLVNISKGNANASVIINSDCTLPLGDDAVITGGVIINSGTLNIGTGTLHIDATLNQSLDVTSSITFTGTTIDIDHNPSGLAGALVLTVGSFTADNLTTITTNGSIDNSGDLLPTGLALTMDGTSAVDDTFLTCSGNEAFASVEINKTAGGSYVTLQSNCDINLGNSETTNVDIFTNNGTLTVGTGIWTLNADFNQSAVGASTTFTGTTIDVDSNKSGFGGDFNLTGGSFTANSLTAFNIKGNLNNSADLLPTGLALTLDGSTSIDDSVVTCSGNEAFSSVAISKTHQTADTTIGADCTFPLGNEAISTGGKITNNGTVTIGTGTWTLNGSYVQSSADASTTFTGTTWNIDDYANDTNTGYLTLSAGEFTANSLTTMSIWADLNNSASLLPNGIALTMIGDHTNADTDLNCGNTTFGSITINKTSAFSSAKFASDCTVTGALTRTDGVIDNSDSAVTLTVQGDFSMSTTDAFGGANLTVKLSGGNAQTVSQNAANTFACPLIINKSGNAATLNTSLTTTTEACTVQEGTFDINGNAFTCGSTFTIEDSGTFQFEGDETTTAPTLESGSKVIYKGNGDTNPDSYTLQEWSYHHLTVNMTDSNDTVTGNGIAEINVAGNLALDGGIFTGPTLLNVTGNWNDGSGSFTHNSGTVVLNGSNQTITGTTTFNNFTKAISSAETLTWPASARQTFAGTMTLTGQSGAVLSLRSSSPETQWEIDPQATRTVEYLSVQDSNNVNATQITTTGLNITDDGRNTGWLFNNLPTATTPSSVSQTTDGLGRVSFTTTISDADSNDTKLKVEYSDDNGATWYDPDLVSATPSSGSVDLDDANTYQVGTVNAIDTSTGDITLTIVWDTQSASNGNGSLDSTNQTDIKIRVTSNDGTADGSAATSSAFEVDNLNPSTLADLAVASYTATTASLTWTAAVETNFSHYETWYGSVQADVESRSGTALEWDNSDDADLASIGTEDTTITGLSGSIYYFRLWALDDYGNLLSTSTISQTFNNTPDVPSNLGDTTMVNASWTNDNTPTFTFTLSDDDVADTVKYQIQIDDTPNFSSPIVDYTSALAAQGDFTFTVGQAAGNGSYSTGSESQTLEDLDYYWRVRTTDVNDASSSYTTANSGSVAFRVDTTAPNKFSLQKPDSESYTNDARSDFSWKAASTLDARSGLSHYMFELDNGDSGDFSIDEISATDSENYETSRYAVSYKDFDDSDSGNNVISVHTRSSSSWPDDENDGRLKEGKRTWKITAVDTAGNNLTSSRTLFVDKSEPEISNLLVDETVIKDNSVIGNPKPAISGRLIDYLAGDKDSNRIASGPKEVSLKIEKQNALGGYSKYLETTITLNKSYWSSDDSLIERNVKNDSDKYSVFSYAPETSLSEGRYRVKLVGTDNAGNTGDTVTYEFTVGSLPLMETKLVDTQIVPTIEPVITDTPIPLVVDDNQAETAPESEPVTTGYDVKVKVVDLESRPVIGAKLTMFSTPKEAFTDENGEATFENVEKGDHRILVAYKGQVGEQKVSLDGEVMQFNFTVQIAQTNPLLSPLVIGIVSFLSLTIIILLIWNFRLKTTRH
ncbi:MAG: hypothetical protein ABIH84_02260 [bacterium]